MKHLAQKLICFLVIFTDPYSDRSYTYAQTRDVAAEFGKGLKSVWEWRKGQVLALYTPNDIDAAPVMWGCFWAGGTVTTTNPAYTADELAFQLKDSGARAIVTQRALMDTAMKAARQVGIPEDMIILLGNDKDNSFRFKHFSGIKNLAGTSRYRRTKLEASKDVAFLPYSSGTTGKPKGVMLSHQNITSDTAMIQAAEGEPNLSWRGGPDGKGDKLIAFLPFFHIYGEASAACDSLLL